MMAPSTILPNNLPNILIIMTDQQKATASHLWGSHLWGNPNCQTPHLAALAQQGVRYQNAFTPHPLCMPARASFWTAQYPHSHGSRRNETPLRGGLDHGASLWHEAGYHVGLIGKNHCFERAEDLALFDTWCEISHGGLPENSEPRGMAWFRPRQGIDAAHAARHTLIPQNPRFGYAVTDDALEDYGTGLITGQTLRFLEQHQDEPFALWVSYPDPHEPWVVPRQYADLFPPDQIVLPPWREHEFDDGTTPQRNEILYRMLGVRQDSPTGNHDDLRRLLGVYYGMIRFIDDGVGAIMAALARLRLAEKTIVVFCSDHGDFMGEHAMQCKGGVFYDCLTHVPLIVAWPGTLPANVVDASMVNLIDVIPTLLQLQGLPIPRSMHGQPLPTVTPAAPRDAAFSEYGAGGPPFTLADLERMPRPWGRATLLSTLRAREAEGRRKMVRTHDWKYVHDPLGDRDELYDLRADPWELTNVTGDARHASVLAEMRLRLADWSIQTEDAQAVPLP
jgi:arylsulfatase A-like enzyme